MAERNIVGGMFGISPEMYTMARDLAGQQQAASVAQPGTLMSPSLAPFYAQAAQQGQLIGRAAGSLLGVEDPELMKIRDVQQMRTQFDVSTPQGLRSFAQALGQKGYTDLAIQATARAADIDKDIAAAVKSRREAIPAAEEQANRIRFAQLVEELGPEQGAAAFRKELQEGKVKVAAASAGPGAKNVLEIDKDEAKNLIKVRNAAEKSIPLLEGQLKSVKQGMIQGTFSDARAVFANSMASLGIKNKEILDLLTSTETFKANRIGLASAVAKELGVNPTDRDFQASLDRFASGTMQPEVAEAFINDLLTLSKQNLKNANDGLNYYRRNDGSFAGYERPLPSIPGTTDPLQNMSLQELKALEQKLSKEKR
jgi:hypothetical protein